MIIRVFTTGDSTHVIFSASMYSLNPSHCPQLAAIDDKLMDSADSHKQCSEDDKSKCESTAPRNIVAADVTSQDCLEELLGVTERGGIPVSARIPADRGYSTGHLNGVEGDLADHRLLQGIESSVSEVSTVQGRNAVTLRFAGPVPPEHVSLIKMWCRVLPARPRSLQCMQCGRLGHATAICWHTKCCLHCGQSRASTESCAARAHSVNCGHNDAANTPTCRKWQEARKEATILASSSVPLSR
ncbi:hypothetical protein HPB51_027542 [Rhipicephalus microplus]|uniref:CCHC-type domain-containing protein n=1 Tax=Rhipicephalus microplus TaxID=6941 RepID=A0A9J6CZY7_RHIMP|nr:hypothetical protein HPB51_027542 [Rhipicephalus microplus]